jgi:hypothetical protein
MIERSVAARVLLAVGLALGALLVAAFLEPGPGAAACYTAPDDPCLGFTVRRDLTDTAVVTVTNTTDAVNGNTTSIAALLGNPGADGISFREALIASNGTPGPKRIAFAPVLAGGRIVFSAKGDLLALASGDLTIDGDVDHDGRPDITLDGSAGVAGPATLGLILDSSHNTVTGLALEEFSGSAIFLTCLRAGCEPKLFTDNRIISNTLATGRGPLALISLTPMGLLPVEEMPNASDVLWQDIVIAGNILTTTSPDLWQAVSITAGIGGASRNRVSGLTITGNRITGGWLGIGAGGAGSSVFGVAVPPQNCEDNLIEHVRIEDNAIFPGATGAGAAIWLGSAVGGTRNVIRDVIVARNRLLPEIYDGLDIIAGDANSAYFGAPGPIQYADGNRVEDVLITDNTIEAPGGIGITVGAGNFGNRDNEVLRVKIIGNTISHCQWNGIDISAGYGAYVGESNGDRSTRGNRVSGLEIRDNRVSDVWRPIWLKAGLAGGSPLVPVETNRIEDAVIAGNRITDFSHVGIQLMGGSASDTGSSASANSLSDILVTENRIEQVKEPGRGRGIQILGASSGTVAARQNTVTGIDLTRNEIIGTGTGIEVLGGSGAGSQGNAARVPCPAGNRMTGVPLPWSVRNDIDGASDNLAQVTWCSYLPLTTR